MIGYWLFQTDNRPYCFVWERERAEEIKRKAKQPLEIVETWVEG